MQEVWPAILLAWIAGFVDALGYLALSHVFTSHMSGNAAALGAHAGLGDWREVILRAIAIPSFAGGVALGTAVDLWRGKKAGARFLPAFLLELLFLGVFIGLDHARGALHHEHGLGMLGWLTTSLAAAMGLQSATLRRAGGARIRTTFVTGMLTNMAENLALYLCHHHRQDRVSTPEVHGRHGRLAALFGAICLSFLAGAVCGGVAQNTWGSLGLLAPMAALVFLLLQELRGVSRSRAGNSHPG